MHRATQQLTELMHGEMRAEMKEKGGHYGQGGGPFGGAGLTGWLPAIRALVVAGIAALAVPLPVWVGSFTGWR
ncbi:MULTISPECIES: phage holin family protein [unclassified Streptomyces]|uniref:phage holin family protein n=1 Tax=unclassified Streptomyces TaxID=2593676 RepID=UPI002E28F739|nr:phage holin family protein [Streptomyces sp. NBC_00228]